VRAALLASTALLASPVAAQAQSWTGATSTDWFTAGNWSGGVPATNSSPTIDSTNPGGQGAVVNAATNALTQLNLGVNAQGLLTITTGGSILMNYGVLGANAGSTGTAIVTGTGAWNNNNDLVVGGNGNNTPGGTGIFTVKGGGTVNVIDDTVISASSGAVGTVTVDSTGGASSWTNTNNMLIGGVGTGTFNVFSGGTVTVNGATYMGNFFGATGTLNINGANSTWTSNGVMVVGGNDGSGADGGTAVVNVGAGGTLVTNDFAVLGTDFGNATANGTVNVSGVNAVWNAADIVLGSGGTGTINIGADGLVNAGATVILGDCTCSSGTITVSGSNARFISIAPGGSDIQIGADGTGTFNVFDGGSATIQANFNIGYGFFGIGTVNVSGPNSTLSTTNSFIVGRDGAGTLNVSNGAMAQASDLIVGANPGSSGTVSVSGAGTLMAIANTADIGLGGDGTFNLTNGAAATFTDVNVGAFGFGTGLFSLGAGTTATLTGTYTQGGLGTTKLGLAAGSTNGKIQAATAALDGTLSITGHNATATTYTLITPTGGISGAFANTTYQYALNDPIITNTGNDLLLTVGNFALASALPPGTSGNPLKVANAITNAINNGAPLPAAFNSIYNLSGQALVDGLNQLSGEPAAGASQSNTQLMNSFLSLLLNPFGGAPNGNPAARRPGRTIRPREPTDWRPASTTACRATPWSASRLPARAKIGACRTASAAATAMRCSSALTARSNTAPLMFRARWPTPCTMSPPTAL
jgi:T5SS/PEP-CTERM-associated repeat protein